MVWAARGKGRAVVKSEPAQHLTKKHCLSRHELGQPFGELHRRLERINLGPVLEYFFLSVGEAETLWGEVDE